VGIAGITANPAAFSPRSTLPRRKIASDSSDIGGIAGDSPAR